MDTLPPDQPIKKHQRRSHTKSKKGCSQCKTRRIKCDEVHPTCSNCVRRQITCDFSQDNGHDSQSPNDGVNNEHTSPPLNRNSSTISVPPLLSPARRSNSGDGDLVFRLPDLVSTRQTTELAITDMMLLHHYVTIVAPTLARCQNTEGLEMWTIQFVTLGFKFEFILRALLAISAFHLSYTNPQKNSEYDLMAQTHQSIALSKFQEGLPNVDESNCVAFQVFSILVIGLAFASIGKDKTSDYLMETLQWFYLLRGSDTMHTVYNQTLHSSFLKPFLDEMIYSENVPVHTVADADRITDLFRICVRDDDARENTQAYNMAIHTLLSTFIQSSVRRKRGMETVLSSMVWPADLPPKFLESLTEKKPEAMVILAHFCVLMRWAEDRGTWFLQGWSRFTMDAIRDALPTQWHRYIEWPSSIVYAPEVTS